MIGPLQPSLDSKVRPYTDKNVLAGTYLRDSYPPGTRIKVDGLEGENKAVEATSTVLATADDSEACVPNMLLLRSTVFVDLPPSEPNEDATDEP